jgi:hypothetical protein
MSFLGWIRNAFAIEPTGPVKPGPLQSNAIDRVCREIIRRELTLPAQMMLDSSVPLSYMAGQSLRFFEPFLTTVLDPASIREFAAFLERRGALEYISQRLEELKTHDGNNS